MPLCYMLEGFRYLSGLSLGVPASGHHGRGGVVESRPVERAAMIRQRRLLRDAGSRLLVVSADP